MARESEKQGVDVRREVSWRGKPTCLPGTPNGLELSAPAKTWSDYRAELAGSAPASGWAADEFCQPRGR